MPLSVQAALLYKGPGESRGFFLDDPMIDTISRSATTRRLLLMAALAFSFVLYWPGLSGPFLFDDYWNLTQVEKWYEGAQPWRYALLRDTGSIIAARPVSMASFMLTTQLGGVGAFPAKLGNLILHLACGALVWHVARTILRLDPNLKGRGDAIALIICAIWLLHPLQVSTVLYAIQRMSQIAALFVLGAVTVYLLARSQLKQGRMRLAAFNLFLTLPLLVGLGVLGKQNAAVAPLLCAVVELAYFSESPRRHRLVHGFFILFIVIPVVAFAALLAFRPGSLLAGYQDWDFSLAERLLTQPRVLLDYLSMILVPYTPRMGLYTDDFVVSTGLLSPIGTLPAILAIVGVSVLTWYLRGRMPTFFAGWYFFLAAHSVEASFLPLEMYYEHRNYLPSLGILLALAGCTTLLRRPSPRMRSAAPVLVGTLLATLAIATFGRVLVWQSHESIIEQGARHHPASMRAASDMASLQLDRQDIDGAIRAVLPLVSSDNQRARIYGHLYMVGLECRRGGPLDRAHLAAAVEQALPLTTVYEAQMIRFIDNASHFGQCRRQSEAELADAFVAIMDAATEQAETSPSKHVPREIIARLYLRAGNPAQAEVQARTAWLAGRHPPTGALLTRIYEMNGRIGDARRTLSELEAMIDPADVAGQQELVALRGLLGVGSPQGGRAD